VFDKITLETTKEDQADYLPKLTIVKDNKMNKIWNKKIPIYTCMCIPIPVFKNTEVVNELRRLHDNFVLVPADNASKDIVFVCKNYYDAF
jgi:hypothetical protein